MGSLKNVWGDCQTYKGVKLYPFLMEDHELFEEVISVLLIQKNNISDITIIKMSYLKFLLSLINAKGEKGEQPYKDISGKLNKLLKYVFKTPFYFDIDENDKIYLIVDIKKNDTDLEVDNNNIEKIKLNENDFNKIKKIILDQNAISIVKNNLHPDLQEELEENMEYLAKKQRSTDGSIDEQIISYKCEMKFTSYEPIRKMTIFQFRRELKRLDLIKDYQIYKTAEMSGMVTFEKPIPHWRSHIKENPDYSGLLMSRQEFEGKMKKMLKD